MLWIVIHAAIGLLEKHSGRLKVSKILAWCDANLQSSHGLWVAHYTCSNRASLSLHLQDVVGYHFTLLSEYNGTNTVDLKFSDKSIISSEYMYVFVVLKDKAEYV